MISSEKYQLEHEIDLPLGFDVEPTHGVITDEKGSFRVQYLGGRPVLTVMARYRWDGCTPSGHILGVIRWGVPDGVTRHGKSWLYFESLKHDVLRRHSVLLGIKVLQADQEFKRDMRAARWPLTTLYYLAVRTFAVLTMKK